MDERGARTVWMDRLVPPDPDFAARMVTSVPGPFAGLEPEFIHLVAGAMVVLDGCRMEYDPAKEKAAALALGAAADES